MDDVYVVGPLKVVFPAVESFWREVEMTCLLELQSRMSCTLRVICQSFCFNLEHESLVLGGEIIFLISELTSLKWLWLIQKVKEVA